MKFNGLNKNTGILGLGDGDSPFTRNCIYAKNYNIEGISAEEGFSELHSRGKCILGIITTNDNLDIVFSGRTGFGELSEIGKYKDGVYSTIIADDLLAFMNSIEGTSYYNNNGELIVAWWDGIRDDSNRPRLLNIDCLPFKLNVDKTLINPADIQLLNISPDVPLPVYDLISVNSGGGKLKTGAYMFTVAQQYSDQTLGNYLNLSNPVFISKDSSSVYSQLNGNDADTTTSKSITIKILNLGTSITKVTLAVIKKIGGTFLTITIPDLPVVNGILEYNYTGDIEFISSLNEVLIPKATILKAQTGTQLENRLYLGNIHQASIPNIQPYVNGIVAKWKFEVPINLSQKSDSSKDMVFMFDKRQFKSNEVYALYLIGHLPTGETISYHIPGRVAATTGYTDEEDNFFTIQDNSLVSDILSQHPTSITMLQALDIDPNARVHEIFNTCGTSGKMGYWENQNELYPNTDCFIVRNELGAKVGDFRGQKVRHHKMPNMAFLKNTPGGKAFNGGNQDDLKFLKLELLSSDLNNGFTGANALIDVASTDFGVWDLTVLNTVTFSVTKDCSLRLKVRLDGTGSPATSAFFTVRQSSKNLSQVLLKYEWTDPGSSFLFERYVHVNCKQGDILVLAIDFNTGSLDAGCYLEIEDWSFERYEVQSKVLGIALENIKIPDIERAKFVKFELGFAERSSQNSTIISSTPAAISNSGLYAKMYPPDLFTFRNLANYDYLESQLAWEASEGVIDFTDERKNNFIRKAYNSQYVPAYSQTVLDNRKNEEFIYSDVNVVMPGNAGIARKDTRNYIDLKKYKTQMYFNFQVQNVIPTGYYFSNNAGSAGNFYNGDTFLNLIAWYTIYKAVAVDDIFELEFRNWLIPLPEEISDARYKVLTNLFPIESIINTAYMTNNEDGRYALGNGSMIKDAIFVDGIGQESKVVQFSQTDNKWEYNSDYHTLLNFLAIPIQPCGDACESTNIYKFPYRVYRSPVFNQDSNNLNWRRFNAGDYYELPKNKGAIFVLRAMQRTLLINTIYSLFIAGPKDKLATNNIDAYLSVGDVFDRPPEEIVSDDNGYGGCQNRFAAFVCKVGYVFVDRNQGKVFIYNGRLTELGGPKIRNFFRDIMSRFYTSLTDDNPHYRSGLTGAWDERHNRIIISKKVLGDLENPLPADNMTISYSFDKNDWVSEHDYWPSLMYFNRRGLFSVDNGNSGDAGNLFKHNAGPNCIYYNSEVNPSYIDVAISANTDQKIWHQIIWESYAYVAGDEKNDLTFTHIMVYTDHQCTGLIPLNKFTKLPFTAVNLRNTIQEWNFNSLQDIVIDPNVSIIDYRGLLNVANLNANKPWFKKSRFFGKTIVVRFYNAEPDDRDVRLISFDSLFNKAER